MIISPPQLALQTTKMGKLHIKNSRMTAVCVEARLVSRGELEKVREVTVCSNSCGLNYN
jgi:hypothetical protein